MDQLPTAASVARALLSLGRAGATGTLSVVACGRAAEVSIVRGRPSSIALSGESDPCLGDRLSERGVLDQERHLSALRAGGPVGPVGPWLVAAGATTEGALAEALEAQLRHRLARVLSWDGVELVFSASAADEDEGAMMRDAGALVVEAMRAAYANEPIVVVRRRLGEGLLRITGLGQQLAETEGLTLEERRMLAVLDKSASVDAVLGAAGGRTQAIRSLYALRLLGAVAPPSPGAAAVRLLLRKRKQIRGRADAHSLLDLPAGARPDQARGALRKLARDVHPDRFADSNDPALRALSNEVLTALVAAEASLRSA